jgi:hypothetical protein
MKIYKGKTLMEWMLDIVGMDEATLKEHLPSALYSDGSEEVPEGIHTSGEHWSKFARKTLMFAKIQKFTKNIETEADGRAVEDAHDFVERFYFGDEVLK